MKKEILMELSLIRKELQRIGDTLESFKDSRVPTEEIANAIAEMLEEDFNNVPICPDQTD